MSLPPGTLDRLDEALEAAGLTSRRLGEALWVTFEDGFDEYVIDAEEDLEDLRRYGAGKESSPAEIAAALAALNRDRTAMLDLVVYRLNRKKIAFQARGDGHWWLQGRAWEGEHMVGRQTTVNLLERDFEEAVEEQFRHSWTGRPSKKRIAQARAGELPESVRAGWKEETELMVNPVGFLLVDCDEIDECATKGGVLKTGASMAKRALSKEWRLLRELGKRAGNRASVDLLQPKVLAVEFEDTLDEMRFKLDGKEVVAMAEEQGPRAGADSLWERYEEMNTKRKRFFELVEALAVRRALRIDEYHRDWWLGADKREFRLPVGRRLTVNLRRRTPEKHLWDWCGQVGVEPRGASPEELLESLDPGSGPARRGVLAAGEPGGPGELPVLAEEDLGAIDTAAAAVLEEFRECVVERKKSPRISDWGFALWPEEKWYRRGVDTWVTEEWWVEQARAGWTARKKFSWRWAAGLILMVNGDRSVEDECLAEIAEFDPYEFLDPENGEPIDQGLAWWCRGRLPWKTREMGGFPPWPSFLGRAPVKAVLPVARRIRSGLATLAKGLTGEDRSYEIEELLGKANQLGSDWAGELLDERERAALRSLCLECLAQDADPFALRETTACETMVRFGWNQGVATLEENSAFGSLMQEPVSWPDLGDHCLWLSHLPECVLAGRLAARILMADVEREARSPSVTERYGTGSTERSWWKELLSGSQLAAAVAWHRFRNPAPVKGPEA